jgi:hypothetical protein
LNPALLVTVWLPSEDIIWLSRKLLPCRALPQTVTMATGPLSRCSIASAWAGMVNASASSAYCISGIAFGIAVLRCASSAVLPV